MKLILETEKCIGCGTCQALCKKFFKLEEDGKAHIINGKKSGSNETLEIVQSEKCLKESVESCPTKCIHLK